MSEFHTLTDGEGVELDSNVPFRFACCDCGLVHDMVIVSQDGKPVGFAIKRAPEATEERRATLGASFDHWLNHEQAEHDVDSLNKSAIELAREAFSAGLRAAAAPAGDALGSKPDWIACESRRPWVTNSLKAYAQEFRNKEKRCRNAYTKDFMGIPARYVADACAQAAAVFEAKLAALAAQSHPKQHNDGGAG